MLGVFLVVLEPRLFTMMSIGPLALYTLSQLFSFHSSPSLHVFCPSLLEDTVTTAESHSTLANSLAEPSSK